MKPLIAYCALLVSAVLAAQITNGVICNGGCQSHGLVAEWLMNAGSGTVNSDLICGDNMIITAGGGSWTTQAGLSGGAYTFDGSSTYMTAITQSNMGFDREVSGTFPPFSLAVWFNITIAASGSPSDPLLLGNVNSSATPEGYSLSLHANSSHWYPEFLYINTYPGNATQLWYGGCSVGPGYVTQNALHLAVITYNGSPFTYTGTLAYLDGASCGSQNVIHTNTSFSSANPSGRALGLGRQQDGSQYFGGTIGPAYVYNCVLTSGDISTLYANPYAPPTTC